MGVNGEPVGISREHRTPADEALEDLNEHLIGRIKLRASYR